MVGWSVYNFACSTTASIDYKFEFAICCRALNYIYCEFWLLWLCLVTRQEEWTVRKKGLILHLFFSSNKKEKKQLKGKQMSKNGQKHAPESWSKYTTAIHIWSMSGLSKVQVFCALAYPFLKICARDFRLTKVTKIFWAGNAHTYFCAESAQIQACANLMKE